MEKKIIEINTAKKLYKKIARRLAKNARQSGRKYFKTVMGAVVFEEKSRTFSDGWRVLLVDPRDGGFWLENYEPETWEYRYTYNDKQPVLKED